MSRTDAELIREGNQLAGMFYRRQGYKVPDGYRFDQATHPAEVACWDMAVMAYEHIEATDLENAIAEEQESEPEEGSHGV